MVSPENWQNQIAKSKRSFMNRRQRTIVREFLIVIAFTAAAVLAMINFKDWINRSEAVRAMQDLSGKISQYRSMNGMVPPQYYVDNLQGELEGSPRLGDLKYRGIWIDLESSGDEILAYSRKKYHSLLVGSGYVVLRLDGRVEWLGKREFEEILARQQSKDELQILQRKTQGPLNDTKVTWPEMQK
jgi:hypothetical protein